MPDPEDPGRDEEVEEPLAKKIRVVAQEAGEDEESEMEKEPNADLSSEEELVAPDAEDFVPEIDNEATAHCYQVAEAMRRNREQNGADDDWDICSGSSTGSVVMFNGSNVRKFGAKYSWERFDHEADQERINNLYPAVLRATRRLKESHPLDNQQHVIPEYFVQSYENAIEYLLKTPRPNGPLDTCEQIENRICYEEARVQMLQTEAIKFHKNWNTRPCWYHDYGTRFSVQTSYDMIEYLVFAMSEVDPGFQMEKSPNDVWHPEYDEIHASGRTLMEQCIVLDSKYRNEFMAFVKEEKQDLTASEETHVQSLFDQMTSIFNLDFEHFLMNRADERVWNVIVDDAKEKAEVELAGLHADNAEEIHRIFQKTHRIFLN